MARLTGLSFLGTERGARSAGTFTAFNPQTGAALEPAYWQATLDEVAALHGLRRKPLRATAKPGA